MKNELFKRIVSSIILIPLVFLMISLGSYFFNTLILICLLIVSYEWFMMTKKKIYIFFGYIFFIFSFYSIYKIRNIYEEGFEFVLFIMLICICTDIGGFIFGKIFKGPKLTKISPNKTYAGVLGGYILSFIILLFVLYFDFYFSTISIDAFLSPYNIIMIFAISTVSQLGDIVISYFKRQSKKEDTGNLIPGHGGILDRIDGMIFAFPIIYIIYFHEYEFWIW